MKKLTDQNQLRKSIAKLIPGIIVETGVHMREANLLAVASSLAYTTILSIVPALAVSFAIFKAFGGMDRLYGALEPLILDNLTEGASEEAVSALHQFIDNAHAGTIGVSGFVGLVFTTMTMLWNIEKAINQIWGVTPSEGVFRRISIYWMFITLGPLALSVAVGAATSFDFPIWRFFPTGTGLFLIAIGIFFSIYRWVPNTRVHWRYALVSATVTALGWHLARWGFSLYTGKVVTYHSVYGSLSAIPIMLLWIYIVWVIVLTGGSLSVALQRRAEAFARRLHS